MNRPAVRPLAAVERWLQEHFERDEKRLAWSNKYAQFQVKIGREAFVESTIRLDWCNSRLIEIGWRQYAAINEYMSRFGNLEFDQNSEENAPQKFVLKDESHYYSLATTLFESGRFEPALRAYAKVLEYNPGNASAWTGQIRMLIELNDYQEAKRWAEKALATFPNEPEVLAANAVCLARLGDLKAALAFSDASIEESGGTPYVWLARGDVLMARKEKRADYCFEKAVGMVPQEWVWSWLVSRIYAVYKNFAKALKVAQQALARDAARAVVWLQLGRCELALGLVAQAQVSLQHARELDDELEDVHRILSEAGDVGLITRIGRAWRRLFQP